VSALLSSLVRISRPGLALLVALTVAATVAGSALAGGGPGSPPPPVAFTPIDFVLDAPTGQVTMTGTLSCTMPAAAEFSGTLVELVGKDVSEGPFSPAATGMEITAGASAVVECPTAGTYPVALTFVSSTQRGFRPGAAQLYLSMDYDTVPDPVTGIHYPGSVFGVIPVELRPSH